jgi:hypothetical protein
MIIIILKMNDIFNIDELVGHILSFVPRKFIGPCLFVNKRFHKMIKVDGDYENATINEDLYSLNKIKYSPMAVINIAKKYGHMDLMEWLVRNKMDILERDCNDLYEMIGFIGEEELIMVRRIWEILNGLCMGLHFDLIKKYKNHLSINHSIIIQFAYSLNDGVIRDKILSLLDIKKLNTPSIIVGTCMRTDKKYVKSYIETLETSYYIIDCVCEGLILGNHFDIFVWYSKDKNYECDTQGTHALKTLVINNNYEFLKYVIMHNCEFPLRNGIKSWSISDTREYEFGYDDLVKYIIHYKRIDMILFLINEIQFSMLCYDSFMQKARTLGFEDVMMVLKDNVGLFKKRKKIDI